MNPLLLKRWLVGLSMAGVLAFSGCLSNLEYNSNLVLSPDAIGNALVLPYTGLSRLAIFLSNLI